MEFEKKIIDKSTIENDEEIVDLTTDKNLLLAQLNEAKKEVEDWENKYKYLLADLMNTKKRYQKIIDDTKKYKEESIANDLIEIIDDFERLLQNLKDDGAEIIYNKFVNLLSKYDIKPIYTEEDKNVFFNPEYDEAISIINVDDDALDNTIQNIVQKGYFYKDKVLRYQKVIVNKYKNDKGEKN